MAKILSVTEINKMNKVRLYMYHSSLKRNIKNLKIKYLVWGEWVFRGNEEAMTRTFELIELRKYTARRLNGMKGLS